MAARLTTKEVSGNVHDAIKSSYEMAARFTTKEVSGNVHDAIESSYVMTPILRGLGHSVLCLAFTPFIRHLFICYTTFSIIIMNALVHELMNALVHEYSRM
jgi:membrane-associated HD superfamily phosphohydrolase